MNKYINYSYTSQELYQRKDFILHKIDSFPVHKRKVFLTLLEYSYKYTEVDPTQTTLSHIGGFTKKTSYRYMKEFQKLGLLHKTYRYLKSCVYRVEQVFYDADFRMILEQRYNYKFSICLFVLFNASLLLSIPFQSEYVSYINSQIYFNKLSSSVNLERVPLTHARAREEVRSRDPAVDFRKRNPKMLPFSDEEIEKLNIYPKDTLDYAHKRLTREIASGNNITHMFNYFVAICRGHLKENKKTPQRKDTTQVNTQSSWRPNDPAQESFQRLQRLYNLRLRVYNKGLRWNGFTYGELERIAKGYQHGMPLEENDDPPFPPAPEKYENIIQEHQRMK